VALAATAAGCAPWLGAHLSYFAGDVTSSGAEDVKIAFHGVATAVGEVSATSATAISDPVVKSCTLAKAALYFWVLWKT
jgi:hypothetical protein